MDKDEESQITKNENTLNEGVDPDPFSVAFAILGLIFAGGSYLETRRQREHIERQAKDEFRKAWFHAKRTLIHSRRVIEEFATYISEDEFGDSTFLFGKVKLFTDIDRAQELRRLHTHTFITASHIADSLDDLSTYLTAEYTSEVSKIHDKLKDQKLPHSYDEVVILAKDTLALFEALVTKVGEKENFQGIGML